MCVFVVVVTVGHEHVVRVVRTVVVFFASRYAKASSSLGVLVCLQLFGVCVTVYGSSEVFVQICVQSSVVTWVFTLAVGQAQVTAPLVLTVKVSVG